MTAPLRQGEPIVVGVALGSRSYEIVICRAVLATLGRRMLALKPRAKAAIVTDATVAHYHLAAAEAVLASAGIAATVVTVPPGDAHALARALSRLLLSPVRWPQYHQCAADHLRPHSAAAVASAYLNVLKQATERRGRGQGFLRAAFRI